jgi:ABC-type transport system involved in multi-copper enzyme maturation permease subunit
VTRDPGPFLPALLRSTLLIARAHLLRSLVSRRLLACVLVALLPALVAFLVASTSTRAGPGSIATHLGWMLMLQIVVPLVTLIAGSAVIAEEIEDRTITYVFTRPIPRASLLFGRWIATAVLLTALFALATFVLLAAAKRGQGTKGPPFDDTIRIPLYTAVLWGGLVYSAVFASLGAFFKHPMLVGIGYAFAFEGFLANLPGNNQALAIQYYLRSLIAAGGSGSWRRVEGFRETVFQSGDRALATLVILLCLALLLGAWRVSTREYELTS